MKSLKLLTALGLMGALEYSENYPTTPRAKRQIGGHKPVKQGQKKFIY